MTAEHSHVILYGTSGCHLCELAEALLPGLQASVPGLRWEKVDISADNRLFERYGLRIPVARFPATGEELDWPFDELALSAALAAAGRGC